MVIGDKLVGALKGHPVVLAIVIINALFLSWVVHEIGASASRKDALIAELARDCQLPAPKGNRQ